MTTTDLTREQTERLRTLTGRLRGVRKQSEHRFLGLPLYSIAIGPDFAKGEWRGHARGVFALGDVATGIFALGGIATGVVALGGLAFGVLAIGGLAVGLLFALGGMAVGTLAAGGVAIGIVALGGVSLGYYAAGGVAYGSYALDALNHRSPDALELFARWGLFKWLSLPSPPPR